ncbi:MAG TPA: TonB-dependent receptor [Opitutaceae bacterium]|nr:TonB-dependent receptor [Opitutaceae bacterium]
MTTAAVTRWLRAVCAFLLPLAFAVSAVHGADATGEISGNVSNAGTGNLLEGARVELPQLGLTTLTDNTGRFVLSGVPTGTYEVVATYIGLDAVKAQVTVSAGQRAARNFDLTTGIYKLDEFKVTGEREGNAAAITAQRNAPNVKNVVAIDAYGNLPNMNASELAVLLPGVAPELSDEGNIVGFTIRGMGPGSNTITIDGALMASQGGAGRVTRMHTITGSMFDSLELTKGHTPDKGADSLGGTLNLKSRSPLSMKEKRRTTYNFSARWAPPFTEQIPLREEHRAHPLLNVAHQEVFSVLGGERNLGVALNLFYSEQAVGYYRVTTDFQNIATDPAFMWNYQTEDNYNNRKQSSVNAKVDYRLSPNTKVSLNMIYNDAMERFRLKYLFRAFTGNQNQNTVPNATTAIIPGEFTNRVTQVRATAQSIIDITSQMSNFFHRQRHVDFGVEQTFGKLELDYNAILSRDTIHGGGGNGGVLVNRVTNVGWTLDRTNELYPRFTQTAGPDITNPASYRPNSYNFADTQNLHRVRELRANARYKLPTEFTSYLKAGWRWREEKADNGANSRRYNFTGTNSAQLPVDMTIRTANERSGLRIPAWNANAVGKDRTPLNPNLWTEDRYFYEMTKFTATRGVTETVDAAYLMTQARIGKTGILAGVRGERTQDESWGWTRERAVSSTQQQTSDPVGSAQRDYAGNRRDLSGKYTKWFPSVHLTQDLTPNFKARASWSNSFGRPPLTNLMPNETINETAMTVTINNPGLKPQIAETWDASLEYYFEPVGSVSVGWFHKTIKDFFQNNVPFGLVGTGNDNGFGGDYPGFILQGRSNLGTAVIQGWELSYQQQFTFLPGVLKGFGLFANYTYLETHGDWGGGANPGTNEVAGFIPRTGNLGLSWRHRGLSARVNMNYTGRYLDAANAANPPLNLYRFDRTIVNVGAAYQVRPTVTLSVDVTNIFNEEQSFYRGYRDRMQSTILPGIAVTFGVSGRF